MKQEPGKPNADELYENLRTRTISKAYSIGSFDSKHSGYSSGFSSSEGDYEWIAENQQNGGLPLELVLNKYYRFFLFSINFI